MAFLILDTDVASFCFKGDNRSRLYQPHLAGNVLVLSFMTVAELRYWAKVRRWGVARRAKMEEFLKKFLVYPYDDALCTMWAELIHEARFKGRQIDCADAWIAATAVLYGIPLVTHNASDFNDLDALVVISET